MKFGSKFSNLLVFLTFTFLFIANFFSIIILINEIISRYNSETGYGALFILIAIIAPSLLIAFFGLICLGFNDKHKRSFRSAWFALLTPFLLIPFLLFTQYIKQGNREQRIEQGQSEAREARKNSIKELEIYRKRRIRDLHTLYQGEKVSFSNTSRMRGAEYFPADSGSLIINIYGDDKLFEKVPKDVWEGFKKAPSVEDYYDQFFKDKYNSN